MKLLDSKLGVCLAAVVLSASCGSPGIPQPPSLELARPVRDLHAARKGDRVHLTWSVPTETTDHHKFRHYGPTQICRDIGSPLHECGIPITKIVPSSQEPKSRAKTKPEESYTDQLTPDLQLQSPTSNLVYAVNVLNSYGKSAGLSSQAQVPAAPTLPPPAGFKAQLTAEGIRLAWNPDEPTREIPGLRFAYRIYRRELASNKDSVSGEVPVGGDESPTFLDTSFEWEKTYDYRATVVTFVTHGNETEQVEGEDTPPVRVAAHDVFPPAIPTPLQAVFSGPGQKLFIDLVWAPNREPDLAGYNVYRHEPGTEPVKLNSELVKAPAFRDSEVVSGRQYYYSVSAVDLRGNESMRSQEATEVVPSP
jgi:hypothetical protein